MFAAALHVVSAFLLLAGTQASSADGFAPPPSFVRFAPPTANEESILLIKLNGLRDQERLAQKQLDNAQEYLDRAKRMASQESKNPGPYQRQVLQATTDVSVAKTKLRGIQEQIKDVNARLQRLSK